jgi:hypothetical protein
MTVKLDSLLCRWCFNDDFMLLDEDANDELVKLAL